MDPRYCRRGGQLHGCPRRGGWLACSRTNIGRSLTNGVRSVDVSLDAVGIKTVEYMEIDLLGYSVLFFSCSQ